MSNAATTTRDTAPLLRFEAVQTRFQGGEPLFQDLNLEVAPREIVALRGRSGAGKSTALAIAMGLRRPSSGRVLWKGEDLYELDEDERAKIRRDNYGIVLQDGGLLGGLTAVENILVPILRRRVSRADRARALDALEMVGMANRAGHAPDRLSGGEAQRVAIARALFADPALLVIDEPTSSLDQKAAESMIQLIVEVASAERGVLVASHDPAVVGAADRYCDIESSPIARQTRAREHLGELKPSVIQ